MQILKDVIHGNLTLATILLFIELLAVFYISKVSLQEIFILLRKIFKSDKIVFPLISLLFFIGTVIHELSHFFMAIILFLPVREIHVLPEWTGNEIKLGKVIYEKKDFVREVLVGIAPIITGLLLFWLIYELGFLGSNNPVFMTILILLIFILSTTMFSSKQDLIDVVYMAPLFLITAIIIFVFNVNFSFFSNKFVVEAYREFVYAEVILLTWAIGIHLVVILSSKLFFVRG